MNRGPARHADEVRAGSRVGGLLVEGLSFERDGRRVIDGVSFHLDAGRLLAVVGVSGAGKSTLLSLIAGFEAPTGGSLSLGGSSMDRQATPERDIGMSLDDAALHEHLTVAQNLDSAAVPRGEPRERRMSRVRALSEALGIADLLDRKPHTLSAGERRRVAVGRAFIRSPALVLLDEPFANLDRGNRFAIRQMVRELQRSTGATAIVVTHDSSDALAIADDMLVLIEGRARAFDRATELAARPPDLEVAQLVDELGMHSIEITAAGPSRGCEVRDDFLQAARTAARSAEVLLGVRPWHISPAPAVDQTAAPPALSLRGRVIAKEPAGLFTDVIAARPDTRALRARVPASEAQELPIGAECRFIVHEEHIHLFAGPWPGRRIR